eukprot:3221142-Rhodomonas_salina.1
MLTPQTTSESRGTDHSCLVELRFNEVWPSGWTCATGLGPGAHFPKSNTSNRIPGGASSAAPAPQAPDRGY